MSSTTQILFNTPALNSLKRDQLVKLCKRHGVKANGKNSELIDRLKQKASELPPEGVEWHESEEEEDGVPLPGNIFQVPARQSEQSWEMVMDDIKEEDEPGSSSGAVASGMKSPVGTTGEFGAAGPKSSVKSSLKAAIANSFGLKRATALNKETAGIAQALGAQIAGSTTSLIDEPSIEPIPGAPSRPGKPAPSNARLSTSSREGATTTIRLISSGTASSVMETPPRLKPYQTTFDLDLGTPSATKNVWPASPATALHSGKLYPTIPPEDLKPSFLSPWKNAALSSPLRATPAKSKPELPAAVPDDVFSPAKPVATTPAAPVSAARKATPKVKLDSPAPPRGRVSVAPNDPFLFGSPLPRHSMSNNQFGNAAADVLEEMNKRLAAAGVQKVEKTLLDNAGKVPLPAVAPKAQVKMSGADRFAKAHEDEFSKMDSIANHYAVKRMQPAAAAVKRKSEALGPRAGPVALKKSNVAQARVFSHGSRRKMSVPGGFGADEDEDNDDEADVDASDRRSPKRIKVSEVEGVHQGRRVSLLAADNKTEEEKIRAEKKRQREKEVLRKKIEARRSSYGRPSMSSSTATRPSISSSTATKVEAPTLKPKPSRLGLIGAAKSLVRGVWGMGAGAPEDKPANATKPSIAPATTKAAVLERNTLPRKPVASSSSSKTTRTASSSLKVPATGTKNLSARSRSPIPSFDPPEKTNSESPSGGSLPTNIRKSANLIMKVPGSVSLRAKPSVAGPSKVDPIGLRRPSSSLKPKAVPSSTKGSTLPDTADAKSPPPVRKRTISRLLAPTASSLAKRQNTTGSSKPELASVKEDSSTLQQITNGARSPGAPTPRPAKIFSQPLSIPASPTSPSGPKENRSLAATAHTLMEKPEYESTAAPEVSPRKPKTLVNHKPQISRSKIIAKVGEQRSIAHTARPAAAAARGGRARSSIGATPRKSMGVVKNGRGVAANAEVLMSAKKKARQTEYMRRKSRIGESGSGEAAPKRVSDAAMSVDE